MIMSKTGLLFIVATFLLNFSDLSGFSQTIAQYDQTISRMAGKLRQYPERDKPAEELKQYFLLANEADLKLIQNLKLSGQPDIWYSVYQANDRINARQELVKTLPAKTLGKLGLEFVDNTRELEEAKVRAVHYSYALAEKKLSSGDPVSARDAYIELLKVARIKGGPYRDLDKLLRRSILVGSSDVGFELQNRSGKNLTANIVGRLNKIVWDYKRSGLQQKDSTQLTQEFSFLVKVVIDEISVGPDQIKELTYGEERDLYNSEGVVVDTIRCQVNEYRQLKKATMSGRIDFYDKQIGQVVNRVPVRVETVFSNAYGSMQGNPEAAGETTRQLLTSRKAPYPGAEQMILDVTDEFVKKSVEIILAD